MISGLQYVTVKTNTLEVITELCPISCAVTVVSDNRVIRAIIPLPSGVIRRIDCRSGQFLESDVIMFMCH